MTRLLYWRKSSLGLAQAQHILLLVIHLYLKSAAPDLARSWNYRAFRREHSRPSPCQLIQFHDRMSHNRIVRIMPMHKERCIPIAAPKEKYPTTSDAVAPESKTLSFDCRRVDAPPLSCSVECRLTNQHWRAPNRARLGDLIYSSEQEITYSHQKSQIVWSPTVPVIQQCPCTQGRVCWEEPPKAPLTAASIGPTAELCAISDKFERTKPHN